MITLSRVLSTQRRSLGSGILGTSGICKTKNSHFLEQQNPYSDNQDEGWKFRVLELVKKKPERRRRKSYNLDFFKEPREKKQKDTQDWGSVWPGVRSFHPATVPLPLRMGYPHSLEPTPDKWGNAELMKIPNFLHLTPPVIKRQCEALQKFCTPWPKELETEEAQNFHFPLTVTKSSYLHSAPSIRDPRARIVSIQVRTSDYHLGLVEAKLTQIPSIQVSIDSLDLNRHAMDKMLRLVADYFDPKTRLITLLSDRCPISSQNEEYCMYLLTVLYNESLKEEPWEHEKEVADFESYDLMIGQSKAALEKLRKGTGEELPDDDVQKYIETVTQLHNEGEDEMILEEYKKIALKICNVA